MTKLDVPAGTWQIDPSHSGVNFSVRHMMVSKVRGGFGSFAGTISIADDVLDATVEATIDVASIDTTTTRATSTCAAPTSSTSPTDPTITFRSTRLEQVGGDYRLHGDLTIKGTTGRSRSTSRSAAWARTHGATPASA